MSDLVWTRYGQIFDPQSIAGVASHAQIPTVAIVSANLWRIFFSGRDAKNSSGVFALDVDPQRGMRVTAHYDRPVLNAGVDGTFDRLGVGPSCVVRDEAGSYRLFTIGMSSFDGGRFKTSIGLARSGDGLHFERVSPDAVFEGGPDEPYFVSTPHVARYDAGYEMWYVSGTGWYSFDGRIEASYDLRRTVSSDGIGWSAASELVLRASDVGAVGLTRPWIVRDASGESMYFSARGKRFRDGGMESYRLWSVRILGDRSVDVRTLRRVAFTPLPQSGDWYGAMQAYASIVAVDDERFMFYNGNEFGRDGFGWAHARASVSTTRSALA